MLIQIDIRDLATIETLHLSLKNHCTMITGETGAGKSIFIEAIELALGGRASPYLIRAGKEKAEISLYFDISSFPVVSSLLENHDLNSDNSECIIRRVITSDGRSRCYVNDRPASLHIVKELGESLFHLHSQHEQQVLLKSETQREMLDKFADHLPLADQVSKLFTQWKSLEQEKQLLKQKMAERNQRTEYLQFQLQELKQAKLQENEWIQLTTKQQRLANSEQLLRKLQHILNLLRESDDRSILNSLHEVRKTLESLQRTETKADNWLMMVNTALIQLSDLTPELQTYLDETDLDPKQLEMIEARMGQLFDLARKHKITPPELMDCQQKLQDELDSLYAGDEELMKLENQQLAIQKEYIDTAETLSQSRKKAATKLEKEITTTIRHLSLPHGEFKIALEKETNDFNLHGFDKITFLVKTNPDQSLQALAKVVSGGELSRLSLAAHLALAHRTSIPTLVFDEIDTGLSGATAEKIGKLLRKLGEAYQVFCVTHQAQVAACGHHHIMVEKYFEDNITHTRLRLLSDKEKRQEIARMLGGEKITAKTLAHAEEMLSHLA